MTQWISCWLFLGPPGVRSGPPAQEVKAPCPVVLQWLGIWSFKINALIGLGTNVRGLVETKKRFFRFWYVFFFARHGACSGQQTVQKLNVFDTFFGWPFLIRFWSFPYCFPLLSYVIAHRFWYVFCVHGDGHCEHKTVQKWPWRDRKKERFKNGMNVFFLSN